ncbi:hypothetical protein TRVA0_062S00474 [Trichomonascus vanleenenianus]|uniref:uncharacterized protein n=1 Tax=Trichomonascus vanleenenianus TaxID=2268995 RepID=UPI003ECA8F01
MRQESRNLSKFERYPRHPPLAGKFGSGTVDLKFLYPIRVGPNSHTQVFMVEAQSDLDRVKRGQILVAKAYDPVFMDDEGGFLDSFHMADEHYTHEVLAYEKLSEFQGGPIPKFYGSFSLDVPTPNERTREVRLILLEYTPGNSMQVLNAESFLQKDRQQMMKSVVDFEGSVYQRDIALSDLKPEHVIVTDPSYSRERPLVFVDFGFAIFDRILDDRIARYGPEPFLGQYISPILRWGVGGEDFACRFDDWIDWEWQRWLESEYAHTVPSITSKMREAYTRRFKRVKAAV